MLFTVAPLLSLVLPLPQLLFCLTVNWLTFLVLHWYKPGAPCLGHISCAAWRTKGVFLCGSLLFRINAFLHRVVV